MRGRAGERLTRRSSSANLLGRDLAERPCGIHGPVVQRLRPTLAVVESHQPVRELGMSTMLTAQTALDLGIRQQQRLLAFLELANVAEADGDRHLGAEEQLEQQLAAKACGPRRLSQPRAQHLSSARGEGIHLAIWLAALGLVPAPDEAVGREPAQDRGDLPEALAPEVGDARVDGLLDVVAGARPLAEHAQHGAAGGIAARHIADTYIRPRNSSSRARRLVLGGRKELALLPERDETPAVERAGAVAVERRQVLGGGVALVPGEAVFGELPVDVQHDPGARGPGGDRR